jgi:adenylate cyclase
MKITLRLTLTSILVSLLLLTMGTFGFSFYRNARSTAADLSKQILDQNLLLIDFQINDALNAANEQGKTNVRLFKSGRFRHDNFPDLARYWLDLMREHPRLTRLSLAVEATGEWFHVTRTNAGLVVGELRRNHSTGKLDLAEYRPEGYPGKPDFFEPDRSGLDPRRRPWYIEAKQARKQIWSDTYMLVSSRGEPEMPGVSCATPILAENGSLVGVVGASFDVIKLSNYLSTLKVGSSGNGFAFVIEFRDDGTRRVIAHKNHEILLRPIKSPQPLASKTAHQPTRELVPIDELIDRRVSAFVAKARFPEKFTPSRLEGTKSIEFDYKGVRYFGAYSCLSTPVTPDWLICIVMPEDDVLARVYRGNQSTFLIGVVILVVAIAIGLYIAMQVARPLERIARETEAIGRIELTRHPVAHSIVREVDHLAEAIEKTKTSLRSFRKYVPADLIRRVHTTGLEAALGGERRRMTVSFCDIANFTTLSETVSPEELVLQMGDYFGPLSHDILSTGGTVDKYIGDAIMAFWGAPAPTEDHAIAACDSALRNQASLEELRRRWRAEGKPELFARVGIMTGDVIVGNIGSDARLNYTVMGDTVNLASRLEGLGKQYFSRILIGESTYQDAKSAVVARAVDRVTVKGKTEGMMVYELLAMRVDAGPEFLELADLSDRALELYLARDWESALDLFEKIGRLRLGDGPATVLGDRCRGFLACPPAEGWDGVYRMASK